MPVLSSLPAFSGQAAASASEKQHSKYHPKIFQPQKAYLENATGSDCEINFIGKRPERAIERIRKKLPSGQQLRAVSGCAVSMSTFMQEDMCAAAVAANVVMANLSRSHRCVS